MPWASLRWGPTTWVSAAATAAAKSSRSAAAADVASASATKTAATRRVAPRRAFTRPSMPVVRAGARRASGTRGALAGVARGRVLPRAGTLTVYRVLRAPTQPQGARLGSVHKGAGCVCGTQPRCGGRTMPIAFPARAERQRARTALSAVFRSPTRSTGGSWARRESRFCAGMRGTCSSGAGKWPRPAPAPGSGAPSD